MHVRRSGHELPSDPSRLKLQYTFSHPGLVIPVPGADILEDWIVQVVPENAGDDHAAQVGELRLVRLRNDTGFSQAMAADDDSAEVLSIVETVFEGGDYSPAFREAVEMPFTDLLVLDRVRLARPWRGFGLGPIFAAEAIRRLEGGCCAVAVEPGTTEQPENQGPPTAADMDAARAKIAALWASIGFFPFTDDIWLRDTALDYAEDLHRCRKHMAILSAEYLGARA